MGGDPKLLTAAATRTALARELAGSTAVLVLAALLVFAPSIPRLTTTPLGDGGDNLQFLWNAWWMGEAFATGKNPYFCDLQFAPFGVPLALHTLSELPMGVAAALSAFMPLVLALNLVVIASFPLAGICLILLARYLGAAPLPALVGGLAFMFCPFMASKSLGHFNLLFAGLLPLFVLVLLRALETENWSTRVQLALVTAIILFSNIHAAILAANVAFWAGVVVLLRAAERKAALRRLVLAFGLSAGVAAAYGSLLVHAALSAGITPARYDSPVWRPDVVSFVLPLHENSWWRTWSSQVAPAGAALGQIELAVYMGAMLTVLAIAGAPALAKRRFGGLLLAVGVGGLLLAAGPHLQWERTPLRLAGVKLYMPMELYERMPVLAAIGQSGRYMILYYLVASVAAALALTRWLQGAGRVRTGVVCAGLVALIVADFGFGPVQAQLPAAPIPPGPGRVLDARLGSAEALYAQTIHRRPLVGGYVARIPEALREKLYQLPGAGWIFRPQAENAPPPAAEELTAGLHALDVAYVCVNPGSRQERVLIGVGLAKFARTSTTVIFRVVDAVE